MRVSFAIAALLATIASGANAGSRDIETSWGKAGVSLTQYRLDAGVCAARAISLDLTGTPEAEQMVKASRALDTAYSTAWMYHMPASGGMVFGSPSAEVQRVRDTSAVDATLEEIRQKQVSVLHDCLKERGYRQFVLTPDQRARLKRLSLGSEKRRS